VYESFFRFEKPPFKVVPDPSMLFGSRSVREAMSRLEFAVRTGKGITVMTGEVGTGKTTLVNRFLDKAGPDTQTAYIFNPTLSGLQLLKTLADELGVQTYGMAKVDLTRAIYEQLLRHRQAGQRTIVFVDEAQALSREALEELRLISNLETWQEKLLHIFLVGQPELLEKLESFNMRQLRQRVELFIQIEPMSPIETRQYIEHRIRVANPLRDVLFTETACEVIHRVSGGIPRTINIICDASLLVAYVSETGTITPKIVREAAHTIDSQQVSFRIHTRRRPRFWQRLWGSAAAVAIGLALLLTFDTRRAGPASGPAQSAAAGVHGASVVKPEVLKADVVPASVEPAAPENSPATRVLVHVASFRARADAEAFASGLRPQGGRGVYVQPAQVRGEAWYRVFVGDFEDLGMANAYAAAALRDGALTYARAVEVPGAGLEPRQREAH
jgi:general secretion pathway protein A